MVGPRTLNSTLPQLQPPVTSMISDMVVWWCRGSFFLEEGRDALASL